MSILKVFEVIFAICVDIAPISVPLVDASIQIWNSVTINDIAFVKNQEWTGDPPASKRRRRDTFDSNQTDLNSDFSNVREALIKFNISENVQIELTGETLISIALLQLPALFLACFGIYEAFRKHQHGHSLQTLRNGLHAIILIAIPFFLVELFSVFLFEASLIVQIIVEKLKFVLDLKCGTCMDGFMQKLDFLHFLPSKESRDKMLCLEVVKVFFGTCLQLCFQMVLYLGYTQPKEVEYSQIFSIVSSFLLICKSGVDIIRFKRRKQETIQNDQLSVCVKMKTCGIEILQLFNIETIKRVLFYLLLSITSVVCNSGTLILAILVWNEISLIYIITVFAVNILVSIRLPNAFLFVEKCENFLGLEYKYKRIKHGQTIIAAKKKVERRFMRGIFVSWSNIFFLSRPIEESSYYRTMHMVLVQMARSPINFGTLVGLIFYTLEWSPFAESLKTKLFRGAISLIFIQIVNIAIVLRYTYRLNGCSKSVNDETIELEQIPLTQHVTCHRLIGCSVDDDSNEEEEIIPLQSTSNNDETRLTFLDESNLSKINESESEDTENSPHHSIDKEPINVVERKYVKEDVPILITKISSIPLRSVSCQHYSQSSGSLHHRQKHTDVPILENIHILSGTTVDWSSVIEETDIELLANQSNFQNEYERTKFKKLLNKGMEGGFDKDVVDELFLFYPNLEVKSLKKHTMFRVFEENENSRIDTSNLMLLLYALVSRTPEELLRNIFTLVDRNNYGTITKETFKAVVSDIFVLLKETKITDSNLEQLVKTIFNDKNDGKIDLNEFLRVCSETNYVVINCIKEFQSRYGKTSPDVKAAKNLRKEVTYGVEEATALNEEKGKETTDNTAKNLPQIEVDKQSISNINDLHDICFSSIVANSEEDFSSFEEFSHKIAKYNLALAMPIIQIKDFPTWQSSFEEFHVKHNIANWEKYTDVTVRIYESLTDAAKFTTVNAKLNKTFLKLCGNPMSAAPEAPESQTWRSQSANSNDTGDGNQGKENKDEGSSLDDSSGCELDKSQKDKITSLVCIAESKDVHKVFEMKFSREENSQSCPHEATIHVVFPEYCNMEDFRKVLEENHLEMAATNKSGYVHPNQDYEPQFGESTESNGRWSKVKWDTESHYTHFSYVRLINMNGLMELEKKEAPELSIKCEKNQQQRIKLITNSDGETPDAPLFENTGAVIKPIMCAKKSGIPGHKISSETKPAISKNNGTILESHQQVFKIYVKASANTSQIQVQSQEQVQTQSQDQQQEQIQKTIQEVNAKLKEKGYDNPFSEQEIKDVGLEKGILLQEIELIPKLSQVLKATCLMKWKDGGRDTFGTGFLARRNGSHFFLTAGHNISDPTKIDCILLFNNLEGCHDEDDLESNPSIVQINLKELISQNQRNFEHKDENSGDYFALKLDNYDEELGKLLPEAFTLHAGSDINNDFLVMFGFPVEGLTQGSKCPIRIAMGRREEWASVQRRFNDIERKVKSKKNAEEKLKSIVESNNFMFHSVDTMKGNSGTPILVRVKDEGFQIIGIHTGGQQVHWNGQKTNLCINYAMMQEKIKFLM